MSFREFLFKLAPVGRRAPICIAWGQRKPAGEAVCSFRDQVRVPRAAWPRKVPPAGALRQGDEQIGQGDVRAESLHQVVTAVPDLARIQAAP
jgi:hypothetical protein